MFSKFSMRFFIALSMVMTTSSCGLHIGEKQPEPPAPSYSGRGLSCVGQIPKNAEAYVKDQMSVEEINSFVLCIEKAFTSFAQLTRGRNHDSTYTPNEIRDFLQEYFVKSNRISDELMHEFMVIKQAMVGGAPDRITRRELYVAVEILEDLRQEAIRLKPYIKYLNPELAEKQGDDDYFGERLAEANDALNMAIRTFSSRLKRSKSVYSISNLGHFLTEFREFVRWDQHFSNSKPAEDWVRFLRIFKELTVGKSKADSIQPAEWGPLLQAGSRWYLSYLQFRVGVKGKPLFQEQGLQNTVLLAREIFDQAEEAISRQPDRKTITLPQLYELIGAMEKLKWLPEGVKVEHTKRPVEAVVSKIFGRTNESPGGRKTEGLTHESLAMMRHEFFSWASIQWNLISLYQHPEPLQVRVPNLLPKNLMLPLDITVPSTARTDSAWDEFSKVKDLIPPLYVDKCENQAVAKGDPDCVKTQHRSQIYKTWIASPWERTLMHVEPGFHHLSMMNLLRSISTLVFRGYSGDQTLRLGWKAGVTKDEMQAFYKDFRSLGIDLKFYDKRNCKTGERSFIEGKLFTYAAAGYSGNEGSEKSLLTMPEMIEFLAFLYSGGTMGREIYDELKVSCLASPDWTKDGQIEFPLDVQGHQLLNRACVSILLPDVMMKHIHHMPGLKSYLSKLSPEGRMRFVQNQLQTAYSPNSVPEYIEHSELAMVAVIMQYAESVMTRYDLNQDGILSRDEALGAFPVFEGYINKFAQKISGLRLYRNATRNVFLSLLASKQIPGAGGIIEPGTLFKPGAIELDRLELSEVFKVILRRLFDDEVPSASRECE